MFELFDPQADFVINDGVSLPHWYQPGVTYFVTFRTDDSIPASARRLWHAARAEWLKRHGITNYDRQFSALPKPLRKEFHERFSRQYMEALDKGFGACDLARPEISSIVTDCLFHFDSDRYHLGHFVVIENQSD